MTRRVTVTPILIVVCLAAQPGAADVAPSLSNGRAGDDWWALQPLRERDPPVTASRGRARNQIDAFILARLSQEGLEPSPRADPRTLVRRAYFDLLGLPAPPDAIERFERDPSQVSWSRLVDELLASSHYGERWAQHWLDLARFGESDGYEYNALRPAAWHYRDWVIRSLNSDLPYDEFARMQLAGDVILPNTVDGAAAVGFLVAGIHNPVLGVTRVMKLAGRHDELEEMAGTVGQTFLGLTVNCARCHDHKYDPISAREYYQFIAALDGVRHGTRKFSTSPRVASELVRLEAERDALRTRLFDLFASRNGDLSSTCNRVRLRAAIAANRRGQTYRFSLDIAPSVWASPGQATGKHDGVLVKILRMDGSVLSSRRFEPGAWRGARPEFQRRTFRYDGDGNGNIRIQIGAHPADVNRFGGAVDNVTIVERGGNTVFEENFDRLDHHHPAGSQADTADRVYFGSSSLRWIHFGTNSIHAVERAEGNLALQVYSGSGGPPAVKAETAAEKDVQAKIEALEKPIRNLRARAETPVFTAVGSTPASMRVYRRGDVKNPGETVEPGGLRAIRGLSPSFGIGGEATDGLRRSRLAEWVTHRDNGPFHRVIVNRVWHYHFGTGIVDSPNDLGFNGGRPSHPDLLDWMAVWFRDHGYSLKKLHRLLMTSAAYQQTSVSSRNPTRDAAMARDPTNRLLWRRNRRRLDGEAVRDSILELSGALNRRAFGPGYRDYKVETVGAAHYYLAIDPIGHEFNRRTIYRTRVRGERSALLETFDCPDPSTRAPVRNVTTTPSQALAQWNHPFVLRMSRKFAKRIEEEAGAKTAAQVAHAWRLVLGRPPDDDEREAAIQIVTEHGLALLGRVLFNCNETILIE